MSRVHRRPGHGNVARRRREDVSARTLDPPAPGAYKGVDEPPNPFRGADWLRPAGLARAYKRLKALDPQHPLVIIQTPGSTVAQLAPYRPAFDTTGADIFPTLQEPPPPLGAGRQKFRSVPASGGGFRDWIGLHDARLYRFAL